ncbi:MAG: orotidine-5'-phosphate decarboxylase [Thermodesulfobacteriota bacterium]|nr:orotidine-5'-phosphate decarboxylase [Thermodesulfobacteriota bacterium]
MQIFMKYAKDYIIFPLDVPSLKEAKQFVKLLSEHAGMFKVGLELFIRSGPEIIRHIKNCGSTRVFLDLKLHDIPKTVFRAMESIANLGVDFTTVHCGESKEMLKAAVAGSKGRTKVLGITVLTSVSNDDILAAGLRPEFASNMSMLVMQRAAAARDAGCSGVVCSGLEVGMIKERFGEGFIAVTPGIRPSAGSIKKDDQQRITTPARAIQNGSDYLVIGRPIRDANNPEEAVIRITEEIEAALQ